MRPALGLLAAAAVASFGAPPAAQAQADAGPPTLLMLQVARTPRARQREGRLATKLGLALGEFMVIRVDAPSDDFSRMSLDAQIEMVKPLTERYKASGVTWMVAGRSRALMLYLVAGQTGRTLVRTVEATRRQAKLETFLALAVRELLGTAYLFDEQAKKRNPAVNRVVAAVRREIVPTRTIVAPQPKPIGWGVIAGIASSGGISRRTKSDLALGGKLAIEAEVVNSVAFATPRFGYGLELSTTVWF